MKLIIDIDESLLNEAKNGHICLGEFADAVMNGVSYEERPQGDLISREALKKAITNRLVSVTYSSDYTDGLQDGYLNTINEIDNAPTVNPCKNCDLYFKAMTKEEMRKGGAE